MLDEQKMMFKITMRANYEALGKGDLPLKSFTKLCYGLDAIGLLRHKLLEYIKVMELVVVTMLGSTKYKRPLAHSAL